jgi:hypothetical protein
MSSNVAARCRIGNRAYLRAGCLPSRDDREYVALPEQDTAAGRAVTRKLAGRQPSINCPYIHAAQVSDFPFRQKLLFVESIHVT